jgi:hypothetical protein
VYEILLVKNTNKGCAADVCLVYEILLVKTPTRAVLPMFV